MSTGPTPPDDKGPFIADQGLRLLREQQQPRKYVGSSAFAAERQANDDRGTTDRGGEFHDELAGHWDPVPRDQVAFNAVPNASLDRTVIVNDAGLGKSTTAQWLRWEYSQPSSDNIAFCIDISRLKDLAAIVAQASRPGKLAKAFLESVLLDEFCLPEGQDTPTVPPRAGVKLLERLIGVGRVVLLFDGLDHAPDEAVGILARLLKENYWSECRIVLTSRPYALEQHWKTLFDSPDEARGWRFVRLDEFTEPQQRAYLGNERFEHIPTDAREILTVPRVLYYLRKLTIAELSQARTASDVYYRATQRMINEALAAEHAGSMTAEMAQRLLSMIAFHMVSEDGNFDAVSGRGPLARIRGAVRERCAEYAARLKLAGTYDEAWVTSRLRELAAMNEILDCGLLERGCPHHYQFRNRSLQEFFAAQFLSSYSTESALPLVDQIFYWEDNFESQRYRNVWRMFAEMPRDAHDAESWLTAASVLYRPGTGRADTTRRSTEMIYRTWTTIEQYAADVNAEIQLQARRILQDYQSEFSRVLGLRHIFKGRWGWWQWWVARRFVSGFVTIPPGEFTMGSPETETGWDVDERQHHVRITQAFQLHRYLVTNAAYELFDPSYASIRDRFQNFQPVIVSWYDAWCFSKWVCFARKCCHLPTEAQWEYACRAGTTTPFHFGSVSDGGQSNVDGNYPYGTRKPGRYLGKTNRVGSYPKNAYGLYDMHGNVWEWCADWHDEYPEDAVDDPVGPASGWARVLRGGSWDSVAESSRAACRSWSTPIFISGDGFRLARAPYQSGVRRSYALPF